MNTKLCPNCNAEIPANAPGKLCPACVLRGADEVLPSNQTAPSLETLAAAFPDLEIQAFIGQGGMGSVYKVYQPALDRTAALKILSPELSSDPAFEERFAREARVMGKLQHANIVTIFESGEKGGYFYLLMEYIDGVNLRQAMQTGRFTPAEALAVVPGICDALQAAHAEGIWHRDIKPENILLDKNGAIKIVDFGIARLVGDPQRNFTLTMSGHALGSTAYMAPEQHEKPHDVDHRADIYSLGVVIYELLTGELPLGRFPSPGEKSDINARIDEIVLKTLEKERDLRQQSATEVKTDLQHAAVSKATETKPKEAEESVSFFDKPDKFFISSLSLWLGGWAGLGIGLFTSPLLAGLGILAAFFGLIGCGWILRRIRNHTHPLKHRKVLLALVFWPCVFGVCLLPMQLWILLLDHFKSNKHMESLIGHEWEPFFPFVYAVASLLIPLILSQVLWLLFAGRESQGGNRGIHKWALIGGLALAMVSILTEHVTRERWSEQESTYSMHVRFLNEGTWNEEKHYFEEAVTAMAGDVSIKTEYSAPDDPDLPVQLDVAKSGGVYLEWRSPSQVEAKKVQDKCLANLQADLHGRFGIYSLWGAQNATERATNMRGSMDRPVLFRFKGRLTFLIFAPFVVLILLVSRGWSGVLWASIASLVLAVGLSKVNWPSSESDAPPLIASAKQLPIIPDPKFKYSSTRDAITSHIKAAKKGDAEAFKAGLSPRLRKLIGRTNGDVTSIMMDWSSLSYAHQIEGSDVRKLVKLNGRDKKDKLHAFLVKPEHDWKIDSLLPLLPDDNLPYDTAQKAIAAAKNGDQIRFLNSFPFFENVPDDEFLTELNRAMEFTASWYNLSVAPQSDASDIWELSYQAKGRPEDSYDGIVPMKKINGEWKFIHPQKPSSVTIIEYRGQNNSAPTDKLGEAKVRLEGEVKKMNERLTNTEMLKRAVSDYDLDDLLGKREELLIKEIADSLDVSRVQGTDLMQIGFSLDAKLTSQQVAYAVIQTSLRMLEEGSDKDEMIIHQKGWSVQVAEKMNRGIDTAALRVIEQLMESAKKGDEKLFRECIGGNLLNEIKGDFVSAMQSVSEHKVISYKNFGKKVHVFMADINDEKKQTIAVMSIEDGKWKFTNEINK